MGEYRKVAMVSTSTSSTSTPVASYNQQPKTLQSDVFLKQLQQQVNNFELFDCDLFDLIV